MKTDKGINVLGTQVPTDHLQLCFFNANKVMIGNKKVYHIGARRNHHAVMVTDRGQFYGEGPAVFKQFRLNRVGAEKLYPMTPELKAGQDLVERVVAGLYTI